jgi:AcrR family transcriptional regulator
VVEANRSGKRRQIIDAAKQILARDGLAACTARAVASASPLTKSAVHYYFDDIQQVIDIAMREHVTAMVTSLRCAADGEPDPAEKLWAVVNAYLATFAGQPGAAFLWFEYWIDSGRRQSAGTVAATLDEMHALLGELTAQLPADDPASTARALLSWLLGTVVQQQARHLPPAALRQEFNSIVRTATELAPVAAITDRPMGQSRVKHPDGAGSIDGFFSRLAGAVSEFGAAIRQPLAARLGHGEDQIAGPVARLVRSAGLALGLDVVIHAETPLSELSIRLTSPSACRTALGGRCEFPLSVPNTLCPSRT